MPLAELRRRNPSLALHDLADPAFRPYGEPVPGDWSAMAAALEAHAPIPAEGVAYVASCPPLEACADAARLGGAVFGGLPVQVGYCSGVNSRLNGLEWHKASEVLVAADDLVLLLGLRAELERSADGAASYDARLVRGFLVRRGQALELYSGTLHLAPCRARAGGFRAAIVLPRGANEDFAPGARPEGDPLLRKRGKWIIAHPERKVLVDQGVPAALRGPNLEVAPLGSVP